MRILTLLSFFCFLIPGWSEIRFEEVSQQAGITRIGESANVVFLFSDSRVE